MTLSDLERSFQHPKLSGAVISKKNVACITYRVILAWSEVTSE